MNNKYILFNKAIILVGTEGKKFILTKLNNWSKKGKKNFSRALNCCKLKYGEIMISGICGYKPTPIRAKNEKNSPQYNSKVSFGAINVYERTISPLKLPVEELLNRLIAQVQDASCVSNKARSLLMRRSGNVIVLVPGKTGKPSSILYINSDGSNRQTIVEINPEGFEAQDLARFRELELLIAGKLKG